MAALKFCLESEIRQDTCNVYVADILGAIANALFKIGGAEDFTVPLFSDMVSPKTEEKVTAQEVIAHIQDRLKEVMADESGI